MFYVIFKGKLPVSITEKLSAVDLVAGKTTQSRWDWKSMEQVSGIAKQVTAITGRTFIGTDGGTGKFPRFDIVEIPQIGDAVSYGFNGDYYPCGQIVRITKGFRITTSSGKVFNRVKQSGGWLMVGGTWSLVAGTVDQRNPEF